MIPMTKFVVGIRPHMKMFRIVSVAGAIIDEILSARAHILHNEKYFKDIASNYEQGVFKVINEDIGNSLTMTYQDIIFSKDYEKTGEEFNFDTFFKEFNKIWKIIDDILCLKDVRRIGIFGEHTIKASSTSKRLLESLTTITPSSSYVAKFHLSYEERLPTIESIAPDIDKDDYINVIYNFYERQSSKDNPNNDAIATSIDVQKHYVPLLSSKIPDEVRKLYKIFSEKKTRYYNLLRQKRVILNEERDKTSQTK